MRLKAEDREAGQSSNGGWSKAQVELLGVEWPLVSGWKKALIGKEVSDSAYQRFLAFKDKHLTIGVAKKQSVPEEKMPKMSKQDMLILNSRAKALVSTFASGTGPSFTCRTEPCTYPKCLCGTTAKC